MAIQVRTQADLDRIVLQLSLPESDSLEYKQSLTLDSRRERGELLKDLSGMANGGWGVIIFGVSKDDTQLELPKAITPLTDRGLAGRLEDIVRDGIRPPLLAQFHTIEYPPGFVLVAEVTRSPLGPYMVEAGQDRRYYVRIGSRTVPMRESQVGDLYALAARGREQRQAVWEKHDLPIRPVTNAPWLILSAVPEEPLVDLIDPLPHPAQFRAPDSLGEFRDIARAGLFDNLKVWAKGYFAEFPSPGSAFIFRLYRNGAMGWATEFAGGRFGPWFPRALHGQLLYLNWLWGKVGVRTPLELHIEAAHVEAGSFYVPPYRIEDGAVKPLAMTRPLDVSMTRVLLPGDLARAGLRHGVVRDFQSRLRNAFGVPLHQPPMFEVGLLLGPDGRSTSLYLARNGILTQIGDMRARVEESGRLVSSQTGQLIGFVDHGVVLDNEGSAVAAVELAVGVGLPDDFLGRDLVDDVTAAPRGAGDRPNPVTGQEVAPAPTKRWSQKSLSDLLR